MVTHRHQGELIAEFKDRRRPSHEFGKRSAAGFGHSLFMEDTPEGISSYILRTDSRRWFQINKT